MPEDDKPAAPAAEQSGLSKFYHSVADPVSNYIQQVKGVVGILDDAKESSKYIADQKAPMVEAVAPEKPAGTTTSQPKRKPGGMAP